jgi:hypothetical protein
VVAVDDLAAADPLPRILAWLSGHPVLTAELGGTGRTGALNEAPYPRLRVNHQGGDDRDLRWLIAPEYQIEALDDLDGTTGRARLHRLLYLALGALAELPDQVPAAGDPVITQVTSIRGGGWLPLPTGQGRYLAVVRVYSHRNPSG